MAGLAATTQLGFKASVAASPLEDSKKRISARNSTAHLAVSSPCTFCARCVGSRVDGVESAASGGSRRAARLVRMNSTPEATSSGSSPAATPVHSILCKGCDGNGAVVCSQCDGNGLNTQDHFNGRFKAGTTCWLCRGKRQMLCGTCNGAGFMGGFMNTQDD